MIPGEHETAIRLVPDSARKWAPQPLECACAPPVVGVRDQLFVGARSEAVTIAFEYCAQLARVGQMRVGNDTNGVVSSDTEPEP
jgi:hypothetical protein